MKDDAFIQQLQTAFPAMPIDSNGAFGPSGTTYPDAEPYLKHIAGKTWEQVDRDYMVRRSDALGFLDAHHLVAVLPVYLRAIVEDGVWSPAAGVLGLILTKPQPPNGPGLTAAQFDALIEALSTEQRSAVAYALQSLVEQDADGSIGRAAEEALDGYWRTFLRATR